MRQEEEKEPSGRQHESVKRRDSGWDGTKKEG